MSSDIQEASMQGTAGEVESSGGVSSFADSKKGTDACSSGAEERCLSSDRRLVTSDWRHLVSLRLCRPSGPKQESGLAQEGDKEIHQIFEDLDKKLALNSRFYIPEGCIQRWAAEMVVALDALHREGIVCRDLNPNNILLNDRGQELLQMHFFLFAVASN